MFLFSWTLSSLSFSLASSSSHGLILSYLPIDLCRNEVGYPRPPDLDRKIPPPGCPVWRLAVWILSGFAFGLGIIIGYVSSSHFPHAFFIWVSALRRPRASAYLESTRTGNFWAILIPDGIRSKIVVVEKSTLLFRLFRTGRSTGQRTFCGRLIKINPT
jgi:hypothetical protein